MSTQAIMLTWGALLIIPGILYSPNGDFFLLCSNIWVVGSMIMGSIERNCNA